MPVSVSDFEVMEGAGSDADPSAYGASFWARLEWESPSGWREERVIAFDGEEQISRPYAFRVELSAFERQGLAPTAPLPHPSDLLGRRASLSFGLARPGEPTRFVCGMIGAAHEVCTEGSPPRLEIVIVPPLASLMLGRCNEAFFEKQTARLMIEILRSVVSDFFEVVDARLETNEPVRKQIVQYQESRFAFVSRWLEALGVRYHFEHSHRSVRMVLTDRDEGLAVEAISSHFGGDLDDWPGFRTFRCGSSVDAGIWGANAMDAPSSGESRTWSLQRDTPPQELGAFTTRLASERELFDLEKLARLEGERAQSARGEGVTGCPYVRPGAVLQLERSRGGRRHLVERVRHGAARSLPIVYQAEVRTVPLATREGLSFTYRPAKLTPVPSIRGLLRAIVAEDHVADAPLPEAWVELTMAGFSQRVRAPIALPKAGLESVQIRQKEGDQVLVLFDSGSPDDPVVVGGLPQVEQGFPASYDTLEADDCVGIATYGGSMYFREKGATGIGLETHGTLALSASESKLKLDHIAKLQGREMELLADGNFTVRAGTLVIEASSIQLSAGRVAIDAGLTKVSGALKCDTLIATTVVASTYTPGAGNIW